MSYYNEPIETLEETLSTVKNKLGSGSKRVIIYHKSNENSDALLRLSSEVVPLKNVGREGATYLVCLVQSPFVLHHCAVKMIAKTSHI